MPIDLPEHQLAYELVRRLLIHTAQKYPHHRDHQRSAGVDIEVWYALFLEGELL